MSSKERFLEYVKKNKSKNTHKSYKHGLKIFEVYYVTFHNGNLEDALKQRRKDVASSNFEDNQRFARIIESFHSWLIDAQKLSINTARTVTLGIRQFFSFYGVPVKVNGDVDRTIITTSDFVPTPSQFRDAFNVSDLRGRVVISLGLDFGWRIGDFLTLKKAEIPDLNQETPISIERITTKEKVLSKTFISAESATLLKSYLKSIEGNPNPYLFPSNGKGHIKGKAINDALRDAFGKAKVKIPQGKRLRFHCFRKRVLSTCANQRIDVNIAKILVGKSVDKSMLTYLSGANLKSGFLLFRNELSLMQATDEVKEKDVIIAKLENEVTELKAFIKGFSVMFEQDIKARLMRDSRERAKERRKEGTLTVGTLEDMPETNPYKYLVKIGHEQLDKEAKEYQKIIEENGNNHEDENGSQ